MGHLRNSLKKAIQKIVFELVKKIDEVFQRIQNKKNRKIGWLILFPWSFPPDRIGVNKSQEHEI